MDTSIVIHQYCLLNHWGTDIDILPHLEHCLFEVGGSTHVIRLPSDMSRGGTVRSCVHKSLLLDLLLMKRWGSGGRLMFLIFDHMNKFSPTGRVLNYMLKFQWHKSTGLAYQIKVKDVFKCFLQLGS